MEEEEKVRKRGKTWRKKWSRKDFSRKRRIDTLNEINVE
jgi:hypothetical protein